MTLLDDAPTGVLGDQRPQIWTAPPVRSSAGQDAIELAEMAGLRLDPWQRWVLEQSLGERPDGRWAAFEVGVVVGRQNGKGALLECRELAGLFLFGEQLILHTAHQFKTASEAFLRIRTLVDNTDSLRRRVRRVLTGKGDEAIELMSGQRLRFIARSSVSGRGFSGDCVILDEAFELPEASIAALLPTMSARPNPQLWYTSSAVDKAVHKEGSVLARLRRRGMAGDRGLAYAEWSAGDRELLTESQLAALRVDRSAWARTNPGQGIRITEEFVERELSALAPKSFEVERLGIGDWPAEDGEGWAVIPRPAWQSRLVEPVRPQQPAFGVAAAWPDAERCSISVAGRDAGRLVVQVVDSRPGTGWVAGRLAELRDRHKPCALVVRDRGPTSALHAELTQVGFELLTPWLKESATAFGMFYKAAVKGEPPLAHFGQPELDAAVAAAQREAVSDGWVWVRKGPTDISPVESATLAAWGHVIRAPAEYDVLDSVL